MKTLLLTAYDDFMAPIGDLTSGLMVEYAARHKIYFMSDIRWPDDGHPAYWRKVTLIRRLFGLTKEPVDRIIWLDADQMITNIEAAPWKQFTTGFHASRDWGIDATDDSQFSMCGFVCNRDSVPLFDWLAYHKADWIDKPFPEQAPMRYLYTLQQKYGCCPMATHDRRMFNAVPIEVHPSVVEPWRPGDWCAHLTMLPVEDRVKLFHKLSAKL